MARSQWLSLPEYRAYHAAKNRCRNPHYHNFQRYGGRGIEFRFTSYDEFLATVGERPSRQHSLDRIDNDGHYERGNVRWATRAEQCRNSSRVRLITIDGVTRCREDWAREADMRGGDFETRLRRSVRADALPTLGPWHPSYEACVVCSTTVDRFHSKGRCVKCYHRQYKQQYRAVTK